MNISFIGRAMTTQIVCGNSNPISEMWRMLSGISTILTSPSHMPSPLIQKSGWSCLLRYIHTAFLSTTWKLIFRRGVVLWSHPLGLYFNTLSQFFSFFSYLIWSIQTDNISQSIWHSISFISFISSISFWPTWWLWLIM